jgi:hypothetical protein
LYAAQAAVVLGKPLRTLFYYPLLSVVLATATHRRSKKATVNPWLSFRGNFLVKLQADRTSGRARRRI